MNRILNYINATLISLDIPPILRQQSKKSNISAQKPGKQFLQKVNK